MKYTKIKFLGLSIFLIILIAGLSACDLFSSSDEEIIDQEYFNSTVKIDGIVNLSHFDIFSVINSHNEQILDWDNEGDIVNGTLEGTITNLKNEVEVTLIIDNENIENFYYTREPIKIVNDDRANVIFTLDYYAPEVTEIKMKSGPKLIYIAREIGKKHAI